MILIKPSFEVLSKVDGEQVLKNIETAGRTCYKSESSITGDSAYRFVNMIVHDRKHESVIEHESISVRVICDRGVSHELVRHRLASYSQESTRYCNYSKDKHNNQLTFILPQWLDDVLLEGEYSISHWDNQFIDTHPSGSSADINTHMQTHIWLVSMLSVERDYLYLVSQNDDGGGWQPQQARSILPNALKTEVVMTANLREWRHFFKMRTAKAAHPQMRQIAVPLLDEFKKLVPIVFDDILVY